MEVSELVVYSIFAVVIAMGGIYHRWKLKRIRKQTLLALLNDDKYEWRSTQVLQNAIAEDHKNTEELLLEIGARRSTDGQDLWTFKA